LFFVCFVFVLGMSLYITFRTVHALFSLIALVHCVLCVLIGVFSFFRSWGDLYI